MSFLDLLKIEFMKSLVLISGHIVFPLKEGISAYIACSKGIIQTSKVVNIISFTKDFAHFETMNSEYKVTPEKSPVKAAEVLPECA